jgi:hypothetical protein
MRFGSVLPILMTAPPGMMAREKGLFDEEGPGQLKQ